MSSEAGRGVLVAIQAYNCDRTIGSVVKQCLSYAPDVLVVDDGSEDATADQARAAGARLLRHDRNRGKGMAIRTAASEALRGGYSGLLTVDGDGQHEAEDLPAFLEAHRGSPHTMWVGWRRDALERAPVARRLGNQFSNLALKLLAGVRLPDTQCGLRLYPIKLLRSLSLCGTRYETEAEILVKARAIDWDMRPLPVHVRFVDGRPTSHFRPWADTARICILVIRHYLQQRMTSHGGLAMTLAATHAPLVGTAGAAILGIFSPGVVGMGMAAGPALVFHLAMTRSLLRSGGQAWVDTEVDFHSTPGQPEIALTFDDGPDPETTPRVLEHLQRANVLATFFLIGHEVERYPELAADIAARGHAIGNHTYSHPKRFSMLGPAALAGEVDRAQEAIEGACGRRPVLLRPPIGHKNLFLGSVLRERRMRCVTWTTRSMDILSRDSDRLVRRLSLKARPGSIILLHDRACGRLKMNDALPRLIEDLTSRGFRFVTIPGA
ncbi:MAG: polysaccharide deacetylase family protein [Acidobacteria bacterium]|nr:polysaccharide deacetylase family protein [Acidobacteriota bacterium]